MNTIFHTTDNIEKKTILILKILSSEQGPMGSRLLSRYLQDYGVSLSERSVRYYLKLMDERGLTRLIGRQDGRIITKMGVEEIGSARVHDKVGLAISRIENLAFRTTFDPEKRKGLLPVNVSFIPKEYFNDALNTMAPAFDAGLCSSELVSSAEEGEKLGEIFVPKGKIGFATVCSVTINGVLLKNGIPMDSKFGGILQIKNKKPLRFVELIYYSGSSLDPSEAFIRGKMTSVRQAAEKGEGEILANFREIPTISRSIVEKLVSNLKKAGIKGVLSIGEMSEPICQIPVDVNKIGIILIGGLNPVAYVQELNIEIENHTMSTVMDYENLINFYELLNKSNGS
ncbi:MAG: DUF128 domain-containing protein [Deltaproteobacteria bacterium]|nr:DUF128 domain-containing protein [Deltaproteobacteria bacterium]